MKKKKTIEEEPQLSKNEQVLKEVQDGTKEEEEKTFTRHLLEQAKAGKLKDIRPSKLKEEYETFKETKEETLGRYKTYETVVTGATDTREYYILLMVSCLIATFGLYQNSPAVIIGAMVVAPLMNPILGFAAGGLWGNARVIGEAVTTLLKGIAVVLGLSALLTFVLPGIDITGEMEARAFPSLFDIIIALSCGIVGAYAYVNRRVTSAIPGVAISVALMPPLCTVGIGLGMLNFRMALGALLLFSINLVSIFLSSMVVFTLVKLHPQPKSEDEATTVIKRATGQILLSVFLLILIAAPLGYFMYKGIRTRTLKASAQDALYQVLTEEEIYDLQIDWNDDKEQLEIRIIHLGDSGISETKMEEKVSAETGKKVRITMYTLQEAGD